MPDRSLLLAISVAALLALAGCTSIKQRYERIGALDSHGSQWVGRDADVLIENLGKPDRQEKAPSGAAIYVYTWRNDKGVALCDRDYFVNDGDVVGYLEKPIAFSCSQSVGKVN